MPRLRGLWGAVRRGGQAPAPSRTGMATAVRAGEQLVAIVGKNRLWRLSSKR